MSPRERATLRAHFQDGHVLDLRADEELDVFYRVWSNSSIQRVLLHSAHETVRARDLWVLRGETVALGQLLRAWRDDKDLHVVARAWATVDLEVLAGELRGWFAVHRPRGAGRPPSGGA